MFSGYNLTANSTFPLWDKFLEIELKDLCIKEW